MGRAIGIDGCRSGWFYVEASSNGLTYGVVTHLSNLIERLPGDANVCIDIPIGLRDADGTARACDVEARRCLGRGRASSVFPAPLRKILELKSYSEALVASRKLTGKGLTRQAFSITPKIFEIDELMRTNSKARQMLREVHPEVCFWALAGRRPMQFSKKTSAGHQERMAILERILPGSSEMAIRAATEFRRSQVALDDIADALVAAFVATRQKTDLLTLPDKPPTDAFALSMEMVYCLPP